MKKLTEKSPVLLFGTTILAAALLLGGCSGKDGSKSVSEAADPTGSSVSSEESQASDEPIDYSKYNAYLSVADSIYEMDDMLGAYFTVVQDQPEFALSEGMDYALLEDAFSSYISQEYLMDDALTYVDKEPAYPEQDDLITAFKEPFYEMTGVLGEVADYITFQKYEEDGLVKAAELHTKLYDAVASFDETAWPFAEAMDVLDKETEQQALAQLQADGQNIAYYSSIVINIGNEIEDEVLAQIETAETMPALDMTNIETLYTQYQEAYTGLMEAMADPEQVEKVDRWHKDARSEIQREFFTSAVEEMNTTLTAFMEAARNQADYVESYNAFNSAVSELINQYNISIAG